MTPKPASPHTVPVNEDDYRLSAYRFSLPPELIAQEPSPERGASRLYVLDRASGGRDFIGSFTDLASQLPKNSLLVANHSKVIPARLTGHRSGGGELEMLLLTPPPLVESAALALPGGRFEAAAEGLIRPSKKLKLNQRYELGEGLAMIAREKLEFGKARVILLWQGKLLERIWQNGQLPLPPYIRREPGADDLERYQTVYADDSRQGSLAAPTAGLHFTWAIRKSLALAGHEWAELALFVGYGTFSPVRVDDIRLHPMHAEYARLTEETAGRILAARAEGRPIVAVGTTSARVLEAVAENLADAGECRLLAPYDGWLNCFIYPGRPIRVVDALITNFHLPESTLLMFVSALAGRERILEAYRYAAEKRLRFFSYGDAMLIK